MKKIFYLFISILLHNPYMMFAQSKLSNQWISGYSTNKLLFDFNKGFSVKTIECSVKFLDNSSIICDTAGQLLLFTNGCEIYNNTFEMIENGYYINPGPLNTSFCNSGYRIFEASLFLPHPEKQNWYYLFHKAYNDNSVSYPLYYTKIDMTFNKGQGIATEKNKILIKDSLVAGLLTAVRHSNGKDWWVIDHAYLSNKYFVINVTKDTILSPKIQFIGNPHTEPENDGGQSVFTSDGKKYIEYVPAEGVAIYDFDRTNGVLSNYRHITISPIVGKWHAGGCAVSPNSRFLYVTVPDYLYQYDLWADDIAASKELIATYDGFADGLKTRFYTGHLAPDCKIYWTNLSGIEYLHVMNHPDRKGTACDFRQHAIKLPTYISFGGLPNVPNYQLGVTAPYPCDSTLVSIKEQWEQFLEHNTLQLSPNPTSSDVSVSFLSDVKLKKIEVRSLVGEVLQSMPFAASWEQKKITLSTEGLSAGVYVVVAYLEDKMVTQKLVVVR